MNSDVVAIHSPQGKGQRLFYLLDSRQDRPLATPQEGAGLRPGGVDVRHIQRVPNSPALELPECATRSTSVNPGVRTSQLSVWTAIWCFSSKPGLVRP